MDSETILKFLTLLVGFYMAWNIGANDVANAMGTSVGSRALTLRRAIIVAAVFEFSGAFFVGSHVSETIQKGIISPHLFEHDPMIFVMGMAGALLATGFWLQTASYFGLPVSTTHAIVGAVLGFGAIIAGFHAVQWAEVGQIVASWVISPLFSGILSFILFSLIQKKILFTIHPLQAAKRLAPILVFFAFGIFSLSILFDGLSNLHLDLSFHKALWFAMGVGLIAGIIAFFLVRRIPEETYEPLGSFRPQQVISLEKALKHLERVKIATSDEAHKKVSNILKEVRALNIKAKKETHFGEGTHVYTRVEKIFVFLQIISACLVAFAHGANDVANAIGPVAAVIDVLHNKTISHQSVIPSWLLAMGGIGIVVGLATWGWRVIETIGRKITELTPTRGFSAEFGAATTILICSKLGLPISTTHALVGSVLGVGLARGLQALNLKILRDIVLSWVITIPICAVLSIIIFKILQLIF